ncbi:MAG: hypothetical protein IPK13_20810 [Deltaproteobacteria bacterium]|nr:hypothetical protein [Deltaproteobacteria bacterium]
MADRSRHISRRFTLGDFLVDRTFPDLAAVLEPTEAHIRNLSRLATVLDVLVDEFGGEWVILTGFRDAALNHACRRAGMPASVESLHLDGCAADVKPDPSVDLERVYRWIGERTRPDLSIHEAVYYPKKGFMHLAVESDVRPSAKRIIMRT